MDITIRIVSGCCSNYFQYWLNLYKSICENVPRAIVHFYDLGLTEDQQKQVHHLIAEKRVIIHYHFFDFTQYPDWVHISNQAGQWAWKAQCIKDVADNHVSNPNTTVLLWCDSANIILDNLRELETVVVQNGIYSPVSSGNMQKWTHPETIAYFNANRFLLYPNRNAALPAFFLGKNWVREFIDDYAHLSLVKNCIFPEGSSRANHRQDQSVLSCLYYIYAEKYHFHIISYYIGIKIHCK